MLQATESSCAVPPGDCRVFSLVQPAIPPRVTHRADGLDSRDKTRYAALAMSSSSRRAKVITSLNLKGGVGKTHLCWLLASVCQERQRRCLIVDLDQQANITQSFLPDHSDPNGVEQVFEPTAEMEASALVRSTLYEHIHVLPVTGHFARYDLSQQEQWEAARLHTALADALVDLLPGYD